MANTEEKRSYYPFSLGKIASLQNETVELHTKKKNANKQTKQASKQNIV
jgi:hypothetical protein